MLYVHTLGNLAAEINRISARLKNTQPLMRVATGELRDALQDYWRGEGKSIYRTIADDTQVESVTPLDGLVTVGGESGKKLLHRRDGGTVKPHEAKALSIPLTLAAKKAGYASKFPRPLTLIERGWGPPLLVEVKGKGKRRKWTIHYVLRKSVYHKPDPRAMPPWDAIEQRIIDRVRKEFAAIG